MIEEKMNSSCANQCCKCNRHNGPFKWVFMGIKLIIMISIAVILIEVAVGMGHRGDNRFMNNRQERTPNKMFNKSAMDNTNTYDASSTNAVNK